MGNYQYYDTIETYKTKQELYRHNVLNDYVLIYSYLIMNSRDKTKHANYLNRTMIKTKLIYSRLGKVVKKARRQNVAVKQFF